MSEALKEAGMEAVKRQADPRYQAGYAYQAANFFRNLQPGEVFTGEQVHRYIEQRLTLQAHTPNLKSALFSAFIRPKLEAGLVVEAGYRKSVRASNHARICRVYRRVA